jgi:hypothetical protein
MKLLVKQCSNLILNLHGIRRQAGPALLPELALFSSSPTLLPKYLTNFTNYFRREKGEIHLIIFFLIPGPSPEISFKLYKLFSSGEGRDALLFFAHPLPFSRNILQTLQIIFVGRRECIIAYF